MPDPMLPRPINPTFISHLVFFPWMLDIDLIPTHPKKTPYILVRTLIPLRHDLSLDSRD
jgi:hypothetical protein